MRTLAVIVILALAAAFIAPLLVSMGRKLSTQAKSIWRQGELEDDDEQ